MNLNNLSEALRIAEAGYDGYSMSNNARAAYASGRMPLSKWSKADILDGIQGEYGGKLAPDVFEVIKKLPLGFLKDKFLRSRGEWHHTSSMYNATDFYSINDDYLDTESPVQTQIDALKSAYQIWKGEYDKERERKKTIKDSPGDFCYFKYLVWGGSRAHPRAYEEESYGYVKGDWIYFADKNGRLTYGKKGFNSRGTEVIKYLEPGQTYIKPTPEPKPKVKKEKAKWERNPYEKYTEEHYKWDTEKGQDLGCHLTQVDGGYAFEVDDYFDRYIRISGKWSKPIKSVNWSVKLAPLPGKELSTCPTHIKDNLTIINYMGSRLKLGYVEVGNDMYLSHCPNLTSLRGLPTVHGVIEIHDCPLITDEELSYANEMHSGSHGKGVVRV